jgi:phosphoglycerol transferase
VLVRRLSGRSRYRAPEDGFVRHQAGLTLLAVLVATTGGLSLLIALGGLVQVRVWARMAIYIQFFGFCALGYWMDGYFGSRNGALALRRGPLVVEWRRVRWIALAALLVVGVLDQTAGTGSAPEYRDTRAAFRSDEAFGSMVRNAMSPGSMVFQLPVTRFPESGLRYQGMYDYDLFKGYLHAPGIRWSYGGVKGRPDADWQVPLASAKLERLLPVLAAADFSGLYIDTQGYADRGVAISRGTARLLSQTPVRSLDGRLLLFDLRPLRDRLINRFGSADVSAVGRDLTSPQLPVPRDGFYPLDPRESGSRSISFYSRSSSELVFDKSTPGVEHVRLSFGLRPVGGRGQLTLSVVGQPQTVTFASGTPAVTVPLELAPGRTVIRLSSTFPRALVEDSARPDARFAISNLSVVSELQTELVSGCQPSSNTAPLGC